MSFFFYNYTRLENICNLVTKIWDMPEQFKQNSGKKKVWTKSSNVKLKCNSMVTGLQTEAKLSLVLNICWFVVIENHISHKDTFMFIFMPIT